MLFYGNRNVFAVDVPLFCEAVCSTVGDCIGESDFLEEFLVLFDDILKLFVVLE